MLFLIKKRGTLRYFTILQDYPPFKIVLKMRNFFEQKRIWFVIFLFGKSWPSSLFIVCFYSFNFWTTLLNNWNSPNFNTCCIRNCFFRIKQKNLNLILQAYNYFIIYNSHIVELIKFYLTVIFLSLIYFAHPSF